MLAIDPEGVMQERNGTQRTVSVSDIDFRIPEKLNGWTDLIKPDPFDLPQDRSRSCSSKPIAVGCWPHTPESKTKMVLPFP